MSKPMGFITAGGHSSRMGRDKAWLDLGGRPMIETLIAALEPVTSNIAILANQDEYRRLGYPVFADTHKGIGPLEAIRTALENSTTPHLILVGCDMPFVSSELLAFLTGLIQKNPLDGEDRQEEACKATIQTTEIGLRNPNQPLAIVPLNEEGRPEPLCALYAAQALPLVTDLIMGGGRKVSFLFERIPTRFVGFQEVSHLPNARFFYKNINTPEDFEWAKKIVSPGF